jgi:hypothetical protein
MATKELDAAIAASPYWKDKWAEVTDKAVAYADAFKAAVVDGGNSVHLVAADMKGEDDHEELYRAVWSLLDSKTRSAIKRLLAEAA